jgi:hypothetical protein
MELRAKRENRIPEAQRKKANYRKITNEVRQKLVEMVSIKLTS